MKKILVCILTLVMCLSVVLCGCGKKNTVDENHVTVKINADALNPEELSDLDKFAKDHGFDSAELNEKEGVVKVVINKIDHDKLVYSLGVSLIRNVYGMIDSEKYPYIKNIERDDIFSDITVIVEKKGFEKAGEGEAIAQFIADNCLVYLMYEDIEQSEKVCTVRFKDEKTGEILSEKTYSNN